MTSSNALDFLPTTKTISKKQPYEYHWLLYGQPKIGKSTMASQFNEPLFIATEDRLKALDVYKIPFEGALTDWPQFLSVCSMIANAIKENNFQWKTIVIDTVDNLHKMCTDYVCRKYQMQHPSDKEYGKGWSLVNDEFIRVLTKLTGLGKGVIFVSHHEERPIKTRTIDMTKIGPSISGKAGKLLMAMVDIIAYIGFDPDNASERVLYLQGNELLEAGDTTNTLPPKMPFNYKLIEAEFMNAEKIEKKTAEKTAEKKTTKK